MVLNRATHHIYQTYHRNYQTKIGNQRRIQNPVKHLRWSLLQKYLNLSWRRPLSYRNQSIDLLCKSVDWFLYNKDLRHHERIKKFRGCCICKVSQNSFVGVDFDLVPTEIFQKSNISYPAYDGVTNASFLKNLCLY